jgi:hypothetical protein
VGLYVGSGRNCLKPGWVALWRKSLSRFIVAVPMAMAKVMAGSEIGRDKTQERH